jgi:hypothetical protein
MGDAAVSTSEDAAEAQLSSRPVHTLFNQERHLVTRQVYEQRRSAALAEWRALMAQIAACRRAGRATRRRRRYFDKAIATLWGLSLTPR